MLYDLASVSLEMFGVLSHSQGTHAMYLIERNGTYYFNRRIPKALQEYDPREMIRETLATPDRKTALKLALAHNDKLEAYWLTLLSEGKKHSEEYYRAVVARAKALGFNYYSNDALANAALTQIVERLAFIEQGGFQKPHVEAVLGGAPQPVIKLEEVFDRYKAFAKDKILGKSPNQVRKWENPRNKAIRNLVNCVGNKAIHDFTREDALLFRDWWIGRLEVEELVSGSANKDLIYVKTMISCVVENLNINLDVERIFKKITIYRDDGKKRLPFDSKYIIETFLNASNLGGLNEQARYVLYAFADTGAGLNELTGLLPEDIFLENDIPHIYIRKRKGHSLKNKFRERKIPLVGYALEAFKACPTGFTQYYDRPDALSTYLSQYLRENKLLPSDQHTVYSLRHSFQDRLLAANAPDRVQADLMGHKFNRPAYGDGAALAHKLQWLQQIQLKEIKHDEKTALSGVQLLPLPEQ